MAEKRNTLYDIPVYEVEERDCDVCCHTDTLDLMTRNPRHVHLCKTHLEEARSMFVHDVI